MSQHHMSDSDEDFPFFVLMGTERLTNFEKDMAAIYHKIKLLYSLGSTCLGIVDELHM